MVKEIADLKGQPKSRGRITIDLKITNAKRHSQLGVVYGLTPYRSHGSSSILRPEIKLLSHQM